MKSSPIWPEVNIQSFQLNVFPLWKKTPAWDWVAVARLDQDQSYYQKLNRLYHENKQFHRLKTTKKKHWTKLFWRNTLKQKNNIQVDDKNLHCLAEHTKQPAASRLL